LPPWNGPTIVWQASQLSPVEITWYGSIVDAAP
jgi:hypothetical protein